VSHGPEYVEVERPFLDQLERMGWQTVDGAVDLPSATGRSSFREVILEAHLREALRRINLRNGREWL